MEVEYTIKKKVQASINEEIELTETLGADKLKAEIVETVPNPRRPLKAKVSFKSMPSYDALTAE